jgi:hypothetical protein
MVDETPITGSFVPDAEGTTLPPRNDSAELHNIHQPDPPAGFEILGILGRGAWASPTRW